MYIVSQNLMIIVIHLTQGDETASLYCALQTLIIQTRES